MTISQPEISTPPNNKRLEGAFLPDNPSPASKFLIGTIDTSELDSSGSKQTRRQISNRDKTAISSFQQPQEFQPQRHHRDHKNLVQCRTALMATRLSPSHDSPHESQVETAAPRVTL